MNSDTPRTDKVADEPSGDDNVINIYTLARQLERELNKSRKRDGCWFDKWGACKICDSKIPHGHANNCDLYKLERELNEAKQQAKIIHDGFRSDHQTRHCSQVIQDLAADRDRWRTMAQVLARELVRHRRYPETVAILVRFNAMNRETK